MKSIKSKRKKDWNSKSNHNCRPNMQKGFKGNMNLKKKNKILILKEYNNNKKDNREN